jgi:ElaB/YqjD/DUF883 family membrane-anchored ribosome-binding protein
MKGVYMVEEHRSPSVSEPVGASTSVGRASSSAQEWRQQIQETGKEVRHNVQELATQGKEVAAEYYEEGRERVLAWQQQLENQVREKPIQSLLIAAGIGLLFGLLKRR